jgi:hypothetical protein
MKQFFNILFYAFLIIQFNRLAIAETFIVNKESIENNYIKLYSEDFKQRDEAVFFFSQLKREYFNDNIFKTAYELLVKEITQSKEVSDIVQKGGTAENLPIEKAYINTEAFGVYYSNLCDIVGRSGNKTFLPVLIDNCISPKVLINFGDDAVEPVLYLVANPSVHKFKRIAAISVLGKMLEPKSDGYVASGKVRDKIKKVVISLASDKDSSIRLASVRSLGDSKDNDVIPILEKIAQSDPHHFEDNPIPSIEKDVPAGKKITRYPVRTEAQKALKKIKEKDASK